jgi:hypothetical protein
MSDEYLIIPPTLQRLRVPRLALEETRELLALSGAEGLEAVVLWLGSVVSATEARVEEVYFPRQIAYYSIYGLAVEIPVEEWTELALRLSPGQFVLAKLHTHSTRAYHSDVDAANPYLCHEGAISITVPDFASAPLADLTGCSVNVLRGQRWIELRSYEIRQMINVEEDAS